MIAPFIFVLGSIAAPDLYFLQDNTDLTVAKTEFGDGSCRVCLKRYSHFGDVSVDSLLFDEFPSVLCRVSITGQTVWILEVGRRLYGGPLDINSDVTVGRCLVSGIKGDSKCIRERTSEIPLGGATSSVEFARLLNRVADQSRHKLMPQQKVQFFGPECDGWRFYLYSEIVDQLRKRKEFPYICITAVEPDVAIIGVYLNRRILFVECRARHLSKVEAAPFEASNRVGGIDTDAEALEWSSLGVVNTELNTWATGFWIDGALHLIGDDGHHEGFRIVDHKIVRQEGYSQLPTPNAICQFPSGLWVLSRDADVIIATRVPAKVDEGSRKVRLADLLLETAARKVMESD